MASGSGQERSRWDRQVARDEPNPGTENTEPLPLMGGGDPMGGSRGLQTDLPEVQRTARPWRVKSPGSPHTPAPRAAL